MTAVDRNYFKRAGIRSAVTTPLTPLAGRDYLFEGGLDVWITAEPEILLAKERGGSGVAVGSLLSKPTSALIWLPGSRIHSLHDLRGKTIGIGGLRYEQAFLEFILARAHLQLSDVKMAILNYNLVPALLKGRVDAILGSSDVAGPQLRARGASPVVIPVTRFGIPKYDQMVLFVREGQVRNHPASIRKFMAALAKGTAFARAHPEAAKQAIAEDPETELKPNEIHIKAILPLLSKTNRLNPGEWDQFAAWMRKEGLIAGRPALSQVISNAYLRDTSP